MVAIKNNNNDDEQNWEPEPEHLAWQRQLIRSLGDGGYWAIPATASTLQLHQANKTFVFLTGDTTLVTNQRVIKVFNKLGWTQVTTEGKPVREEGQ